MVHSSAVFCSSSLISSDICGILHRQYYTYRYLKGRRNTQADAVSSQSHYVYSVPQLKTLLLVVCSVLNFFSR